MEDDSLLVLYRGVEMRTPFGFDAFFKAYGTQPGIESLCKVIKGHAETCRALQGLFQDRAEAEEAYALKLRKISMKMIAAMKNDNGTVATSLKAIATAMADEAQHHIDCQKIFVEKIGPSLKTVMKNYETTLKNVEKQRDKTSKKLKEKRSALKSLKKKCFQKMQEGKDTLKSDGEFYNKSLKLESARAELELLIVKTIIILQSVEKLRLTELHAACVVYYNHLASCFMRANAQIHEIEPVISTASVNNDLLKIVEEPKGTSHKFIEQPLPDFAAEEMEMAVDKFHRQQCISQYLSWAHTCLENEAKAKFELLKALQGMDAHDPQEIESVETTRNQIIISSATQDYLEACQWKFATLMAALEGNPQPNYRHGHCLIRERDSNGHPASILRMPTTAVLQVLTSQVGKLLAPTTPSISPNAPSSQHGVAAPSGYLRVIADYVARKDSEVHLKKGEFIFVILPWDPLWWLVISDDRVGEVPSNCFGD